MKTRIIYLSALLAVTVAPAPASAQFGNMLKSVPGLGGGTSGSAVDPDSFLADTVETTKYMMTAAAILAEASGKSHEQSDLALRVRAINDSKDVNELGAMKAQFQADMDAINANKDASVEIQARMQKLSAEQRQRIASAAFNFALGAYRNVKLGAEAPQLLSNMRTNPRLLMKVGQLKIAAELVMMEGRGAAQMAGSIHEIMSASKVAVPAEAETTKPKAIEL